MYKESSLNMGKAIMFALLTLGTVVNADDRFLSNLVERASKIEYTLGRYVLFFFVKTGCFFSARVCTVVVCSQFCCFEHVSFIDPLCVVRRVKNESG